MEHIIMFTVREISLGGNKDWDDLIGKSETASFFQTKEWFSLWVEHFAGNGGYEGYEEKERVKILGVFENDEMVGIAPLYESDKKITFLGTDPVLGGELVSDFGDIIAKQGREREVWEILIKEIQDDSLGHSDPESDSGEESPSKLQNSNGILHPDRIGVQDDRRMECTFIREESPSFGILKELGGKVEEVDTAPYIDLPKSWDEYLLKLDRHDRHELRRKMRKLEGEGAFQVCPGPDTENIEEFFRLMQLGNEQKRNFLSEKMRDFFKDIFATFAPKKLLQLCFLKTGDKIVAATLSFIFKDEVLLYNSGFDPEYSYLSPGLLLKAYIIKQSVEQGKKKFDFLRGGERYKYDLGGKERKLYKITLMTNS